MSAHDFRREAAVEVPASLLLRLAREARDEGADFVADKIENLAVGALVPGWGFQCAVCGRTDPHTREGCR